MTLECFRQYKTGLHPYFCKLLTKFIENKRFGLRLFFEVKQNSLHLASTSINTTRFIKHHNTRFGRVVDLNNIQKMENKKNFTHCIEHLVNVDGDESDCSEESGCSSTSPQMSQDRKPRGGGVSTLKRKMAECTNEKELQELRLKINSRERRRMHDLNSALDGLREVMPYANGPSVRKLSKIATLLLAKNYILMLNSSLEEMKKLVSDVYQTHPIRSRAPPAHLQPPHVQQFSPSMPAAVSVSSSGPSHLSSRDLETIQTVSSKEGSSPIPNSLVSPHDRHMFTSRWPVPCACSNCMLDSMRVSYPKYPTPIPTSSAFHK